MGAQIANASMAAQLPEYIDNVRALLRRAPGTWRLVVERQILATLLPALSGHRARLEPDLWALLCLCLDGHEAEPPALSDALWERAFTAAQGGRNSSDTLPAAYPRAARAVADAILCLRETGVFPRPLVQGA
ncbi:MAG: hypothetical protein HY903_17890 [Deltaproteobacteria bacterium]|nr:hypothetical protein [Deltaproteobacteria bacterium]